MFDVFDAWVMRLVAVPVRTAGIAAARRSRIAATAVETDRVEQAMNRTLYGTSTMRDGEANPLDQFAQWVETGSAATIAATASGRVGNDMIALAPARLTVSLDAGGQHNSDGQKLRFHRLRSFSKVEASGGRGMAEAKFSLTTIFIESVPRKKTE